jgi:uncharacterized membrane protein YjjB (DUF3815 family)
MKATRSEDFLTAALKIGRTYLSCGGSISVLEDRLTCAGSKVGLSASVHATPLSITISCTGSENFEGKSLSTRIGKLSPNLGRLAFADRLLILFSEGELMPKKLSLLVGKEWTAKAYPKELIIIAIFGIGFAASYSRTLNTVTSLIGGLITLISYFIGSLFSVYFKNNDTLKEFSMCFFSISISIVLTSFFTIHPSHIFIGTLALILPGLTLTSAIGDLIEENFQTGLVKLAKTALVLLSIGFAYILSTDGLAALGFTSSSLIISEIESVPQFFASLFSTLGLMLGFCILLKVPRKAILGCILVGLSGSIAFRLASPNSHPYVASFVASLLISILARILAYKNKTISQIYIIPSILVLVPGLLAFSYLQPLIDSSSVVQASQSVLSSLMIAAAISFGLLIGQLKLSQQKGT